MKMGLLVLSAGKWHGKLIPITRPTFVIGRDPRCHLRPASPVIDERHCAIICREDTVFLRDLDSASGTFLNGQRLKGQVRLEDDNHIKVGPIEFTFRIKQRAAKVDEGTSPNVPLNETLLETRPLPSPPEVRKGGRRKTSAEAAGNLLAEYLKGNR